MRPVLVGSRREGDVTGSETFAMREVMDWLTTGIPSLNVSGGTTWEGKSTLDERPGRREEDVGPE